MAIDNPSTATSAEIPHRSPTITDLADALGPVVWMAEITETLVEQVTRNILLHERETGSRGSFGPVDGLTWIMTSLTAAIADAKRVAEDLAEGRL